MLAIEQVESGNPPEMSDLLLKLWLPIHPPNLLHRNQNRRIFVFEQEHQELGGFRLACVAANGVNIVGAFIKRLSRRKSYGLSAIHGHDNTAFQHIDEPMRVVPVNGIVATRRIFDVKD